MKVKIQFLLTFFWSIAGSASLTIFAAYPLFYLLMGPLKLTQITYLSVKTLGYNFDELMNYLLNPFNGNLVMPDFKSSPEGLAHFSDVKCLFLLALFLTVILSVPAIKFIKKVYYVQFYQELKLLLLLPVCLGILTIFGGFDLIFINFHRLLFRDTTWLFDPATDPVINILPESYFLACFTLFAVLYSVFWGILLLKTKRRLYHEKN